MEERQDYWRAKRLEITCPNESLCLIVDWHAPEHNDGPKDAAIEGIEGIEGRYVKTHLCGLLVHGEALYTHLWFDAHHKHEMNQVVTFIAKV